MNREDVMIGDWVYNSLHKPVRVTAAPYNYYMKEVNLAYYDIEECTPIPLTREIILKNLKVNERIMQTQKEKLGIDNPEWLCLTYKNEHFEWGLSWELSLYNEGFSLFIYDCPMPEIHYVHELQHFLKLCGINKEIVL